MLCCVLTERVHVDSCTQASSCMQSQPNLHILVGSDQNPTLTASMGPAEHTGHEHMADAA